MLHTEGGRDFTATPVTEWSHPRVPFKKSKELLDGILDFDAVTPWTFRDAVAYCFRTQTDYDQPFQLAKHAGKHSGWKPCVERSATG